METILVLMQLLTMSAALEPSALPPLTSFSKKEALQLFGALAQSCSVNDTELRYIPPSSERSKVEKKGLQFQICQQYSTFSPALCQFYATQNMMHGTEQKCDTRYTREHVLCITLEAHGR